MLAETQLHSKIEAFREKREEERRLMFIAVVGLGWRVLCLGGVLTAAASSVLFLTDAESSQWSSHLLHALFTLGYFIIGLGVLLVSCCPYDLFNLEEVCHKGAMLNAVVAFFVCIRDVAHVRHFPHLDAVLIFLCLFVIATLSLEACGLRFPQWWPTITGCMTWYMIFDAFCWGGIFLFHERNDWVMIQETPSYVLGCVNVLYGVIVSVGWCWHRWNYADVEYSTIGRFFKVVYSWLIFVGLVAGLHGVAWMKYPKEGSDYAVGAAHEVVRAPCLMLPSLAVILVGQRHFFETFGRSFDKEGARLRRDGAFVAEFLENVPVRIGQTWWIHREAQDESYPPFDPRRCWQKGSVTMVREQSDFAVRIQEPSPPRPTGRTPLGSDSSTEGCTVRVRLPNVGIAESKEDLLLRAQRDLRCVEFENLSPELMYRVDSRNNPELQATWHALSRPVRPGERIDYFMSNSWYDNPERKWEKLVEVAEKFHRCHARYPTFWLDKLCIDQNNITDGLKVLPVNVMACNKLLALCGDTYLSRLWCIWELFTLFAFVDEAAALNRIKLVFLGPQEEGLRMLDGMRNFHVNSAHCYDPNEEARLLQVIDAVGTAHFNSRISNMARMTKARVEKIENLGGGSSARRMRSAARAKWRRCFRRA